MSIATSPPSTTLQYVLPHFTDTRLVCCWHQRNPLLTCGHSSWTTARTSSTRTQTDLAASPNPPVSGSSCITCVDIQEKGSGSAFKPEELASLSALSPDDLRGCVVLLGKEQLSDNQSHAIWASLIEVHGSVTDIPEDELQQLGWISLGIPPSHFANLSLTDVNTIASFGKCTQLSEDQLQRLKDAITDQWLGKELDDFTSYDLRTLRQILCAYNTTSIQMIHPDAYKDAAPDLATLSNCSLDLLKELAQLAVDEMAFGSPHTWTSVETGSIGCVIAGLPSLAEVPAEAFEGITADIINCLPREAFQAMTSKQISKLSPSAANALSRRKVTLSGDKAYALQSALTSETDNRKSSAPRNNRINEVPTFLLVGVMLFSSRYTFVLQNL